MGLQYGNTAHGFGSQYLHCVFFEGNLKFYPELEKEIQVQMLVQPQHQSVQSAVVSSFQL